MALHESTPVQSYFTGTLYWLHDNSLPSGCCAEGKTDSSSVLAVLVAERMRWWQCWSMLSTTVSRASSDSKWVVNKPETGNAFCLEKTPANDDYKCCYLGIYQNPLLTLYNLYCISTQFLVFWMENKLFMPRGGHFPWLSAFYLVVLVPLYKRILLTHDMQDNTESSKDTNLINTQISTLERSFVRSSKRLEQYKSQS